MHIPDGMLSGAICPVTAAMSTVGIAAAAYGAMKQANKPSSARFAAVTALIFAGQMMNFPVQAGTSGHLLGGVLASALLGVPFGVLALALVVMIQCLVFADGGLSVLGANIFNMAIIGAGLGGFLYVMIKKEGERNSKYNFLKIGFASWVSLMLAALACSVQLAFSGTIAFSKVIGSMLSAHAFIGIGEALITAAACFVFSEQMVGRSRKSVIVPFSAAIIIAAMLSPFASGFPDGLEWVAEKYHFLHESAPAFVSPMPDYTIPAISQEVLTVGLAGLAGVFITFVFAWAVSKAMVVSERTAA